MLFVFDKKRKERKKGTFFLYFKNMFEMYEGAISLYNVKPVQNTG